MKRGVGYHCPLQTPSPGVPAEEYPSDRVEKNRPGEQCRREGEGLSERREVLQAEQHSGHDDGSPDDDRSWAICAASGERQPTNTRSDMSPNRGMSSSVISR